MKTGKNIQILSDDAETAKHCNITVDFLQQTQKTANYCKNIGFLAINAINIKLLQKH